MFCIPKLTPNKFAVIAHITELRAIAVLRTETAEQAVAATRAVIAGGFRIVEITYGVPTTAKVIAKLVSEYPEVTFGAGTVLTGEQANAAIDAGAQFLVSPCLSPEMMKTARDRGVVSIPGAFTPTEVYSAWSSGADLVKLFPAVASGPEYLRALRGPLPQIPIIPTSGVHIGNVREWLRAGAVALGAVSSVLDPALIASGE
jgi:2-dehydro-3-deoxyphosphogluconate aldolase / (4S)-4-hydroxy-2-oxoglutarate aldolase